MSGVNTQRIKEIRKKDSSVTGGFISTPFGADGFLIDMFSGLDLEEELRLGGNHKVWIEDNVLEGTTEIKEKYYERDPQGDNAPAITYSGTFIISSTVFSYQQDQIDPSFIKSQDTIIASLYRGDCDDQMNRIVLHTKTILISQYFSEKIEVQETLDEDILESTVSEEEEP